MTELDGKAVLVTGAAAGVGEGIALACAAAGASVVVTARRPEAGQAVVDEIVARGGQAHFVRCDVTSADDVGAAVEATVDTYGHLDALVHNATSNRSSEPVDLEHAPLSLWEEHAAVAITASYRLARAAYEHLRAGRGSLLILTSPAGIDGSASLSFYGVAKAAQRGFLKALAREWALDGIRVNGLAPLARTPALDNAIVADPTMLPRLERIVPLGWIGDSERDIGPTAVFLCSEAARYVTGQTLIVSGGRFMM